MGNRMKLTPKQSDFVKQYLVDLNATQAAIRAGYSPKTANQQGSRLLAHVKVQRAIITAKKKRSVRVGVDVDWVLMRLVENVDRSMKAVEVLDREGESTGEWQYQGAVANRALELIGKHLGMFPERHEMGGLGGGPIKMVTAAEVSDEVLASIVQRRTSRKDQ